MNIENIKEGDYITVLEEYNPQTSIFGGTCRSQYIGFPLKVLAISTPFILIGVEKTKVIIDTRLFSITKLDDKFCELYFKKEEIS